MEIIGEHQRLPIASGPPRYRAASTNDQRDEQNRCNNGTR
jgi:hypothetical protein